MHGGGDLKHDTIFEKLKAIGYDTIHSCKKEVAASKLQMVTLALTLKVSIDVTVQYCAVVPSVL